METLLRSTFGCMTSILTGKSWPQALRAYRMLTGVLLAEFMESGQKTYDEIEEYIDSVRHHATGRLWVDCLIKPVMIANFFIHAENKGDFLLQQSPWTNLVNRHISNKVKVLCGQSLQYMLTFGHTN